jgi:F-type H+-transporting ATPase subunit delta
MAEIATIARPYAEALFKATAAPDLGGTAAWLDELALIAANPQLLQFADNPTVTASQVFDVISGVARSTLPDAARNFLRAVI